MGGRGHLFGRLLVGAVGVAARALLASRCGLALLALGTTWREGGAQPLGGEVHSAESHPRRRARRARPAPSHAWLPPPIMHAPRPPLDYYMGSRG